MNYSEDDVAHIERILETKNFYEILQVSTNATDEEIKASHKNLALQVHPDKNNAPGAKDAFIAVRKATAVLLDKERRKEYNEYLKSPYGFCEDKFDLSEEAVDAILITAGIVSAIGIAAGVIATGVAVYKWLTGGSKREDEEPRYAR
ncbi:dnaJ homolog subfamily C member 18-like [Trichogramma pretiosum]|uniref:dnaJ homolog subfamily C member 18-like n=1 Tax=Trichogramma pretiosum TaxID=7493 RepID=UPI0006C969B0|nr:dnaJ homolog subfamily C member 18-like [Trichogramma pretiosum]XP_014227905.1 dnaJ homolog subfamily C member 18-like [Trichogramma pretiosum]XP_014227906.1 dnaJ homolog subfamily C member 18-like [Trichogramma pretiosum]